MLNYTTLKEEKIITILIALLFLLFFLFIVDFSYKFMIITIAIFFLLVSLSIYNEKNKKQKFKRDQEKNYINYFVILKGFPPELCKKIDSLNGLLTYMNISYKHNYQSDLNKIRQYAKNKTNNSINYNELKRQIDVIEKKVIADFSIVDNISNDINSLKRSSLDNLLDSINNEIDIYLWFEFSNYHLTNINQLYEVRNKMIEEIKFCTMHIGKIVPLIKTICCNEKVIKSICQESGVSYKKYDYRADIKNKLKIYAFSDNRFSINNINSIRKLFEDTSNCTVFDLSQVKELQSKNVYTKIKKLIDSNNCILNEFKGYCDLQHKQILNNNIQKIRNDLEPLAYNNKWDEFNNCIESITQSMLAIQTEVEKRQKIRRQKIMELEAIRQKEDIKSFDRKDIKVDELEKQRRKEFQEYRYHMEIERQYKMEEKRLAKMSRLSSFKNEYGHHFERCPWCGSLGEGEVEIIKRCRKCGKFFCSNCDCWHGNWSISGFVWNDALYLA